VVGFYYLCTGRHWAFWRFAATALVFGISNSNLGILTMNYVIWVLAGLGAIGLLYWIITYIISIF
jgi:hypothetical protein